MTRQEAIGILAAFRDDTAAEYVCNDNDREKINREFRDAMLALGVRAEELDGGDTSPGPTTETTKNVRQPDRTEADNLRQIVDECARMVPWLMGWAEVWHRDAGGYTASDTLVGLVRCRRLLETLKAHKGLSESTPPAPTTEVPARSGWYWCRPVGSVGNGAAALVYVNDDHTFVVAGVKFDAWKEPREWVGPVQCPWGSEGLTIEPLKF